MPLEVIGYTNDLDPTTYYIVSTAESAAAVDWTQYDSDADGYVAEM